MREIWTLVYQGVEKTLGEWGLSKLKRTLVSQKTDLVTFQANGNAYDGDALFAYGSTVMVRRNGVGWFHGRVTRIPRTGNPSAESMEYELSGPWWYLENLVFEQMWSVYQDGMLKMEKKGRAILGQKLEEDGYTSMSLNESFAEVVGYAISAGAPLQLGDLPSELVVPYVELVDKTCAEAVISQMKWLPDAVIFFDYATAPPTMHIRKRESLAAVTAMVGENIRDIQITPRYDLQVPAVVIKYEKTHQVDSYTYTTMDVDKYPPDASGSDFGTIVLTIELSGSNKTTQKQQVKTKDIDPNSISWWKDKFKWLDDATDVSISSPSLSTDFPRELVEGHCPHWMENTTERILVSAMVDYTLAGVDGSKVKYEKNKLHVRVNGTRLVTQEYSAVTSFTEEEPTPVGLAAGFYNSLRMLQYEGSVIVLAEECEGTFVVGRVLNIVGGRDEWQEMSALVQRISEDVENGSTEVEFGPASQLGPQDFVQLLRAQRGKPRTWRASERSSGNAEGRGGNVNGSKASALENSARSPGGLKELIMKDSDGNVLELKTSSVKLYDGDGNGFYAQLPDATIQLKKSGKEIYIDMSSLPESANYISLREIDICVGDEHKKMVVLASEPYAP